MIKSVYEEGPIHYKTNKVDPAWFCRENNLGGYEFNIIKYACRHQSKGREEDIKKLIHYARMILEHDYNTKSEILYATPTKIEDVTIRSEYPSHSVVPV